MLRMRQGRGLSLILQLLVRVCRTATFLSEFLFLRAKSWVGLGPPKVISSTEILWQPLETPQGWMANGSATSWQFKLNAVLLSWGDLFFLLTHAHLLISGYLWLLQLGGCQYVYEVRGISKHLKIYKTELYRKKKTQSFPQAHQSLSNACDMFSKQKQ